MRRIPFADLGHEGSATERITWTFVDRDRRELAEMVWTVSSDD